MLCTRDVCRGSSMGLFGLAKDEKEAADAIKEAREFMELFYKDNKRYMILIFTKETLVRFRDFQGVRAGAALVLRAGLP